MTRHTAKHDALLDELLKDYSGPKEILGEHGLLRQIKYHPQSGWFDEGPQRGPALL